MAFNTDPLPVPKSSHSRKSLIMQYLLYHLKVQKSRPILTSTQNLYLDKRPYIIYNSHMLAKISPEGFDIANAYLQYGTVQEVSRILQIPEHVVVSTISRSDIKTYLDGVYMDMGYRNRNKLAALLDKVIDSKIQDAEETGIYTSKDLFDLITLAHKMRMDEIKADKGENNTTVNVANFGGGQYGKLMETLLEGK